MRTLITFITAAVMLTGCGNTTPTAEGTSKVAASPAPKLRMKPPPEDMRFPTAGLVEVIQQAEPLYGKAFLPGGNIARYKVGAKEYELFLVKTATPSESAGLMFDYKKNLAGPAFIAHFGGYAGQDGGVEVFLFAKDVWFAGIRGLPRAEADALARDFAVRLN